MSTTIDDTIVGRGNADGARLFREWFAGLTAAAEAGRGSAYVFVMGEELGDLEALMRQYHDRPMDLADATLVHLARRESVSTIFTVDYDDFETYRIAGRKRFSILPER